MQKRKQNALPIGLALLAMSLSGCGGGVSNRINASNNFLLGLEKEITSPVPCIVDNMGNDIAPFDVTYPNTMEVIKDWVAQNQPKYND